MSRASQMHVSSYFFLTEDRKYFSGNGSRANPKTTPAAIVQYLKNIIKET
jgi:hypothetical protein